MPLKMSASWCTGSSRFFVTCLVIILARLYTISGLRMSITNRLGQLRATSPAEVRGPIISNGVIGSPRFLSAGLLAGAPGSTLELEFVTV